MLRPMKRIPTAGLGATLVAAWVILSGCGSLVRFGEIEPPEGERALVEVEVKPRRTQRVGVAELEAATGELAVATHAVSPAPVVPSATAADEMSSNVQGLSTPADTAVVDPAEIATDARRLESIYAARGYFRAKNLGHAIDGRGFDRAGAVFEILEDRPTEVSEIVFRGACESAPADDPEAKKRLAELCVAARELVPLRVGDIWTESAYAGGLDILARAFRAKGFLHARVTGDNWVSRDRYQAAVWYQIDAGPLVRVRGDVEIQGHSRVSPVRIRRRIAIEAGDVIDQEALRRTERRVLELGPFVSVQAQPIRAGATKTVREDEGVGTGDGAAGPEVGARPVLASEMTVRLQVAEAARWEATIGPSFVTDFVRLDLALPIAFTHRNLFGELVALTAQARPAVVLPNCFTGEACFDVVEFGLTSKVNLQVPSFFEEFLRFSIDATYLRDPTQATKSQEVGGSVGFSRRIVEVSDNLTARLGYNVAYFNYFDSGSLVGLDPESALALSAFRFQSQDFLAYIDAALLFDLRDSPLDSRNGFYSALTANIAQKWTGSQVSYTRLVGDVRGYWTPRWTPWLTLAARLKVGWNLFTAAQGTPQPARFKSGGATTMRGFSTDRMGDFVCGEPDANGNYINNADCGNSSTDRTYIGGNFLIESNVELRFHLRGGLGLVLFLDAGRLWSRADEVDLGDLFVAFGPGVRYDLPVGPIRLDVGFLLGRQRATEIHFSLGQAF
jgi:outer membrane protein assembly factor BamA